MDCQSYKKYKAKSADFLIDVFKEETVLNVWQSESKVRKNSSHSQRQNVCRYGKWREQWNVPQGTNGNKVLGMISSFVG